MDREGAFHTRRKPEFEIGYRHCALPQVEWFAAAWFELESGDGEASRAKIKELLARRIATQPLSLPNAGSVFRNPPHDHAAHLIESCGLKGLSRGGARVSEKHANFIVNPDGTASAADIRRIPKKGAGAHGIDELYQEHDCRFSERSHLDDPDRGGARGFRRLRA